MVAATTLNPPFPDSQNLAFTSDQAGRPQVYKVNVNGGAAAYYLGGFTKPGC
jgi:Tol biopolymer transport system component